MLKSYIKIGLRNLLKYKVNTAIHVLGLAIGLAAFLLINQYVSFERSYDRFHNNSDRLYRLPYSVVLTESHAKKYFNSGNAVGETITFLSYGGKDRPFKVTGVIANPPENTHYKFNMLISLNTLQGRLDQEGWNANNYYSYVLLDENVDLVALNEKLPALSLKLADEDGEIFLRLALLNVRRRLACERLLVHIRCN